MRPPPNSVTSNPDPLIKIEMASTSTMLILANDKAADAETTLLFRERKFTAHVPSKLVNVHAYGISLNGRNLTEDIYYANLSGFMASALRGKMIIMDANTT